MANFWSNSPGPMEALSQRDHLYGLYNDPNWLLQAGLGDIEFEQDMYDDFRYGDPALDEMGAPPYVYDALSSFPDDSYDKLAIEGLRQHSTQGLGRYLDRSPYDVGPLENRNDLQGMKEPEYKGNYAYSNKPGWPNFMDFNLPALISDWNRKTYRGKKGNLQNQISDTARHEYKHAIYNNKDIYSHPAIFGSGARYNLDPVSTAESFHRFDDPQGTYEKGNVNSPWNTVKYSPHRAGELAQETTQKYARPPKGAAGFSTGGLVSLVL